MSHYTVLIVGEDYEELLKPFDENTEVEQYISSSKEQLIVKEKESIERTEKGMYAEYLENPAKYEEENGQNQAHIRYLKEEFPNKLTMNDEQIYQLAIKYEEKENLSPDGGVYSTYNPKSKWDWYSLGGRWSGSILLKDGKEGVVGDSGLMDSHANRGDKWVDQARFQDIDWAQMERIQRQKGHEANWDKFAIEGDGIYRAEYYIEKYKTKEEYVRRSCQFSTFAVLTPDGIWHEAGEMGWFGMSSETHEENQEWETIYSKYFLDKREPSDLISIVDCHI